MKEVPSHRPQQVADLIKRELARILLFSVRDPRIRGVTLTQIIMSPDLREAKVYFDWMGDSQHRKQILDALTKSAGFLRRELAKDMTLRDVPRLCFFFDETRELYEKAEGLLDAETKTHGR